MKACLTSLAVIPSLTGGRGGGAAKMPKAVILSTTRVWTLKQIRAVPLICGNQVINCQAAAWPALFVAALY